MPGHVTWHPASRASSCLCLYWGGEKEALPESRELFEAAAARTSGLVNLVFSRQTVFFQCEHPFSDKTDGYNWARCTMTNQDGFEICLSCSKPNTSYSRRDSYGQFMPRVTGIFEIWTVFWNLHVSFEHCQRGFKVPVEVSLFYWRYKALNFSLHYNIKYFKNNNCFPSILNLFFFLL